MSDMSAHPKLAKRAILYRMVMSEHVCPWGLKAKDLLKDLDSRLKAPS